MATIPTDTSFTTSAVADLLGVNKDKVLAWIRAGELQAVNVAASPNGKRPRFRILQKHLDEFLARRAAIASAPTGKKTAGQKSRGGYPEFISL